MMNNQCNVSNRISKIRNAVTGVSIRKVVVQDIEIYILYISEISDRNAISNNIIKPLLHYHNNELITPEIIISSVVYVDDIFLEYDEDVIIDFILQGETVILLSNNIGYLVANTVNIEKRSTEAPQIEGTIRSPRDAFTENIEANLSLIRYRIKSKALKVEYYKVGKRTKSTVAVLYMVDIANPKYVKDIKNRLQEISVDGILESGYIQKFISNDKASLFPQSGISEKSDSTCAAILSGKVCIMVEGSNLALICPQSFIEFFDAADDHYDNTYIGVFVKIMRYFAVIITLTFSSLYVALVAYNPDIIPSQYILAIAASRVTVPVNAFTEALLMELIVELLREASIRLPKQIGSAVSIVGTIVIGQAAASAGLVSPLMIIIVALSLMASFAVPDYTIMNPIRILKFLMLFLTGIFGLFGLVMGITLIVVKLASITSFGIPYTAPVAPFYFKDIKDFILSNIVITKSRPRYQKLKDKTKR